MKWIVGAVVALMGVWCSAQEFVGHISYPDVRSGTLRLLDGPDGSKVWEFRIKGRAGFMRTLYEIHGAKDEQYEVAWGEEEDTLRVKAKTVDKYTGYPLPVESMLRYVLNSLNMVSRKEGDVYEIIRRPGPIDLGGLERSERIRWVDPTGELSLDVLARRLCELGRGYRVEYVMGSPVWLRAPFVSFGTLLWVLQELDPGIQVLENDGVVIRARGRLDRPERLPNPRTSEPPNLSVRSPRSVTDSAAQNVTSWPPRPSK